MTDTTIFLRQSPEVTDCAGFAWYNGAPDMTERVFHIGDVVRKLRKERDISLIEFAALTGLDKGTISELERGKSNPKAETLEAAAKGLGLSDTGALYARLRDLTRQTRSAASELSEAPHAAPSSLADIFSEIHHIAVRLLTLSKRIEELARADTPPPVDRPPLGRRPRRRRR